MHLFFVLKYSFFGNEAGPGSSNLTNATAIGYNAKVDVSNKIRLGNSNITVIEGQVAFTNASDRRLKQKIKSTKYGLDEVLKLEPVDYVLKSNGLEQIGFIAQDVKPLIPEVVTGNKGLKMIEVSSHSKYITREELLQWEDSLRNDVSH